MDRGIAGEGGGPAGVEQALAAAGWPRVMDDLLRGICHDLNGRVSSLEGLLMLLGLEDDDTPVVPYLESEAGRLAEVVRALRLLSGDPAEAAEPILASDVADRVGRLHPKHRGLEAIGLELQIAEGLAPMRAGPTRVDRLLLVLLSRAGWAALELGAGAVRLEAAAFDGTVGFHVGPWKDGPLRWDVGVLEGLCAVAAVDRGKVRVEEAGGVRVAFPAMTRPGG